jgi:hypothetical protein
MRHPELWLSPDNQNGEGAGPAGWSLFDSEK